jgi:small subunit ribosomal protein S13
MARIAGIDLPAAKRVEIALTYIFGIGRPKAHSILDRAKVDYGTKVRDLTEDEVGRIRRVITSEEIVEGDLRKNISLDIKRLMDIGCYRGIRHRKGLPVHGQRTHPNARTRKGKRRAIAGKKKEL